MFFLHVLYVKLEIEFLFISYRQWTPVDTDMGLCSVHSVQALCWFNANITKETSLNESRRGSQGAANTKAGLNISAVYVYCLCPTLLLRYTILNIISIK